MELFTRLEIALSAVASTGALIAIAVGIDKLWTRLGRIADALEKLAENGGSK